MQVIASKGVLDLGGIALLPLTSYIQESRIRAIVGRGFALSWNLLFFLLKCH